MGSRKEGGQETVGVRKSIFWAKRASNSQTAVVGAMVFRIINRHLAFTSAGVRCGAGNPARGRPDLAVFRLLDLQASNPASADRSPLRRSSDAAVPFNHRSRSHSDRAELVSCSTSSAKNTPDSLTVAVPCKPLTAQNRARQQAGASCSMNFRETTLEIC